METAEDNKMGRWGATSYIVGNMLGSGIFITPTAILNSTNSVGLALVVWAISALIAALGAYCYVELGTSIRRSGSDFAYMCYVKWNAVGFVFMASACVLTFPLTLAIQAEAFSEYIVKGLNLTLCPADPAGGLADPTEPARAACWRAFAANKLIGFSLIWLLLYLNFFSLKTFVARFQMLASAAKLLAAAIVVGTGFYYLFVLGERGNLAEPFAGSDLSAGSLANAFFSGLFSYDGWDILNFGAEDIRNPRSSMQFAVVVGISTVALLYVSMNLSYFTVLTVPEIRESIAVATTFAQRALGSFHYCMPFLVSILLIGSLNSSLFAASRCMFAAARQGQLPAFIGCKNARHDSPRAALFFHVLLAVVFSFIGGIEQLINYVAFGMWMQRCFTMCALLYIRLRHVPVHPGAIRTPLALPALFLGVCLALVGATVAANFATSAVGLAMFAAAGGAYALALWPRSPLRASPRYRRVVDRLNYLFCVYAQIIFDGFVELDEIADDQQQLPGEQQQGPDQEQQQQRRRLADPGDETLPLRLTPSTSAGMAFTSSSYTVPADDN